MKDISRKLLILAAVAAVLVIIDIALCVRVFRPRLLDPDLCAGVGEPAAPYTTDRYAAVLPRFVDARGLVDYKALKDSPQDLNDFLRSVASVRRDAYDAWTGPERTAFAVNAFNALTLRVILDHYPIRPSGMRRLSYPPDSIRQIPGLRRRLRFVVMGEQVTLDQLTKRLEEAPHDPRIHVAMARAAMGSAPLRREPYHPDRLDEQLDDQAQRFLARPENFRIDRQANKVYLSRLFDWFAGDFVKTYAPEEGFGKHPPALQAVLHFIAGRLDRPDADYLRSGAYAVEYTEFDWALNKQRPPPAPPSATP